MCGQCNLMELRDFVIFCESAEIVKLRDSGEKLMKEVREREGM